MMRLMSSSVIEESVAVLRRTPAVLDALLRDLPEVWVHATEGEGTWSPFVVLGHLVHCEKVDWIPRLEMVLQYGRERTFAPVDREAQFRDSADKSMASLLDEFASLRRENVARLLGMKLGAEDFEREGMHPALGPVTLRNLLTAWTAHDLAHTVQVTRVMARRYRADVGPFASFLSVMR